MSTNMTIFLLFFGVSLLDALTVGSWWRALAWVAVGLVSFAADVRRRARRQPG